MEVGGAVGKKRKSNAVQDKKHEIISETTIKITVVCLVCPRAATNGMQSNPCISFYPILHTFLFLLRTIRETLCRKQVSKVNCREQVQRKYTLCKNVGILWLQWQSKDQHQTQGNVCISIRYSEQLKRLHSSYHQKSESQKLTYRLIVGLTPGVAATAEV